MTSSVPRVRHARQSAFPKARPPAARLGRAARKPTGEAGDPPKAASRRKCVHFRRKTKRPREEPLHSPSRSPFRPPHPLTFGFRLRPSSGASTYSGSVLGASGTLGGTAVAVQGLEKRTVRTLRTFLFSTFPQQIVQPVDKPGPFRPCSPQPRRRPASRGGKAAARSGKQLSTWTRVAWATCGKRHAPSAVAFATRMDQR